MERVMSSFAATASGRPQQRTRVNPLPAARTRTGGRARGSGRGSAAVSAVNSPIHLLFSQEVVRRGLDSSEALEAQQGAATGQQKAKLDVRKLCCPATQKGVWEIAQAEALDQAAQEPQLAGLLHSSIISHKSLGDAMAFVLANKLSSAVLLSNTLLELFQEAYRSDPKLVTALYIDLQAVMDRDPACQRFIQPVLFFKGYQSLQAFRLSHHFWERDRQALAIALQSQISQCFAVDIHPAARLGTGLFIDHATGVVIGETAVVGENVSILHHVTLGGTGSGRGDRHPKVGNGVLIGAGASILGNITIGDSAKIGAGSVVLSPVPAHATAVGVPARAAIRKPKEAAPASGEGGAVGAGGEAAGASIDDEIEPALLMDQSIDDWLSFDWVI